MSQSLIFLQYCASFGSIYMSLMVIQTIIWVSAIWTPSHDAISAFSLQSPPLIVDIECHANDIEGHPNGLPTVMDDRDIWRERHIDVRVNLAELVYGVFLMNIPFYIYFHSTRIHLSYIVVFDGWRHWNFQVDMICI